MIRNCKGKALNAMGAMFQRNVRNGFVAGRDAMEESLRDSANVEDGGGRGGYDSFCNPTEFLHEI